jgi:hypothetical protein
VEQPPVLFSPQDLLLENYLCNCQQHLPQKPTHRQTYKGHTNYGFAWVVAASGIPEAHIQHLTTKFCRISLGILPPSSVKTTARLAGLGFCWLNIT